MSPCFSKKKAIGSSSVVPGHHCPEVTPVLGFLKRAVLSVISLSHLILSWVYGGWLEASSTALERKGERGTVFQSAPISRKEVVQRPFPLDTGPEAGQAAGLGYTCPGT